MQHNVTEKCKKIQLKTNSKQKIKKLGENLNGKQKEKKCKKCEKSESHEHEWRYKEFWDSSLIYTRKICTIFASVCLLMLKTWFVATTLFPSCSLWFFLFFLWILWLCWFLLPSELYFSRVLKFAIHVTLSCWCWLFLWQKHWARRLKVKKKINLLSRTRFSEVVP